MSASPPPRLSGVLETVLYVTDDERALRFYKDLLGMRLLSREPGRHLFFRAGASVFLLFVAESTRVSTHLPPHGAEGSVHTCFLASGGEYDRWKLHMEANGVRILQESRWEPGLSFYFEDPDGNLLEIADRDIWPR